MTDAAEAQICDNHTGEEPSVAGLCVNACLNEIFNDTDEPRGLLLLALTVAL